MSSKGSCVKGEDTIMILLGGWWLLCEWGPVGSHHIIEGGVSVNKGMTWAPSYSVLVFATMYSRSPHYVLLKATGPNDHELKTLKVRQNKVDYLVFVIVTENPYFNRKIPLFNKNFQVEILLRNTILVLLHSDFTHHRLSPLSLWKQRLHLHSTI